MRFSLWLAVFAVVALPGASAAQIPADSLVAGEHVRYELTAPLDDIPEEGEGTFEALSVTAVTLSGLEDFELLGSVELPRQLIDDFQVTRGTKNVGLPVAIALAGVGCAIGFSLANDTGDQSGGLGACFGGVLAGGTVGFVLGSFITGPRWEDIAFD